MTFSRERRRDFQKICWRDLVGLPADGGEQPQGCRELWSYSGLGRGVASEGEGVVNAVSSARVGLQIASVVPLSVCTLSVCLFVCLSVCLLSVLCPLVVLYLFVLRCCRCVSVFVSFPWVVSVSLSPSFCLVCPECRAGADNAQT